MGLKREKCPACGSSDVHVEEGIQGETDCHACGYSWEDEHENTGLANPANGYVVLTNGCDEWSIYTSLDELVADQINLDPKLFGATRKVYELGKQVKMTARRIVWEDVE